MKEISNEEIKKAIIENVTYRTSRDNNKNNIRIKKFLNTAYPDLIIFFEVDKRTGNVSVSGYENYEQWKIKQDEKEKKFNEEYMEMNRRAEQVARFAKRYSTPEGKERLEKSIKKRFGRDGIKAIANFEIINKYASS
ncbi:MAG: hypothetical protein RSA99_04465, partial [Oscillospiraceae bacterium]